MRIITLSGPVVDDAVNRIRAEYRLDEIGTLIVLAKEHDETRVIGLTALSPDEALRTAEVLRQYARSRS